MSKKIIALLLCCVMALTMALGFRANNAEAKSKHYYVAIDSGAKIVIKKNKAIVTGKFYDYEVKEPWKHIVKMKKRKFSLSNNVIFESDTEDPNSGRVSRSTFKKNCNKGYYLIFEVKSGKVTKMIYSFYEPQL